jgi:hypothetical protein
LLQLAQFSPEISYDVCTLNAVAGSELLQRTPQL